MTLLLSGREYHSLFCYKHHTVPGRGHCSFQTLGGSLWPKADHFTMVWLQGKERLSIRQYESPNYIRWKCLVLNKMRLSVKLKHSVGHCHHVTWSALCVHTPGPCPDFPVCVDSTAPAPAAEASGARRGAQHCSSHWHVVQNQWDAGPASDLMLLFRSSKEWTKECFMYFPLKVLVTFNWFIRKFTFTFTCGPIFNLSFKCVYERFWYKKCLNFNQINQ